MRCFRSLAMADDGAALSLQLQEGEGAPGEAGENGHVEAPSLEQVREKIDAWLATIEIGGKEERGYDSADLSAFAVEHGLEREEPELIYKSFVDLRVGTVDEREKMAAAEKLAAGTELVVEVRYRWFLDAFFSQTIGSPPPSFPSMCCPPGVSPRSIGLGGGEVVRAGRGALGGQAQGGWCGG
eukprot:COSAG02_NODE_18212_length_956_cov_1.173302_1_plen_183_part_00